MEELNELTNVRKLATLATILEIHEIPEALNIEQAVVRGWRVVVQKGLYKPGDRCIYVEIDAVMPDGLSEDKAAEWKSLQKQLSKASTETEKENIKAQMVEISKLNKRPEFEFLRSSKFRIKTKRIFDEISQGICFPLDIIPGDIAITDDGQDLTNILGITQYVAPDPAIMGRPEDAKGDLENIGLMVSDEERLENLAGKYPIMRKFRYIETEKLEGTSFTCYLKNNVFGVCGRTMEYNTPPEGTNVAEMNVYWKTASNQKVEEKLRALVADESLNLPKNISLSGELIGEGIQGNIYKLKGQTIKFYYAYDIDNQSYLDGELFIDLMNKMGLDTVPVLGMGTELPENYMDLLLRADAMYTTIGNSPKQLAEGIVFTAMGIIPKGTRVTRAGFNRLSFKAKSRAYDMGK